MQGHSNAECRLQHAMEPSQRPSKDGKLKEAVQYSVKIEEWVEVTSSKKTFAGKNRKSQGK